MEARKIEGVPVNDGKGVYDIAGLIETLIMDCNNQVKQLVGGNYIAFANLTVQMVQKLSNVLNGYKQEIESRDRQIAELSKAHEELLKKIPQRGNK